MSKNINDLRRAMFDTLAGLRSGDITVEQAKAMSDVGQVIINSAKIEVEYIKATSGNESPFLNSAEPEKLPNGVVGIIKHRIAG
ncbi:hypothetical protein [Pusillimonas sp. ANT_WB101]|uniref:hypothetical protein n=1 Tax=Pusillimonas sp. ANT_WB101 TaxID=2597356 RepID=UPI0011EDA984|nr:hypothetical protein [Pusillimonas sp. ANT_WB101]KAA0910639.1 hypothetical protein FQ179_01820 [Pusillimonas sp. ANT_WB101]